MTRLFRFIVPIACFLIFQGVYAIDISFSASSGGGTVGIAGSYDVDDSVGVSGKASASFDGGVSMTDSQSLSGSGDADIKQVMYGSGGADYVLNYALDILGATSIKGTGRSTLTPVAGSASRSVSTTGTSLMTSELSGVQGGDFAGVWSYGQSADVSTTQSVDTGQSVTASQSISAEGLYVWAYGGAIDAYGNWAETSVGVLDGRVVADQEVEAGNSAFANQTAELEGGYGWAWAAAEDEEGNEAWTESYVEDGDITTGQYAAADDGASASQTTVVEGEDGRAESYAEDDEMNRVMTWAMIENGTLETDQMVWAGEDWWFDDEGAVASQHTFIEADRGNATSMAWDDDGNFASTSASMTNGTLETHQDVWAGDDWWFDYEGAEAYQDTFIEADRGNATSSARDDDGNFANTSASMTNGTLETLQGAWAVEDWGDDYEGVEAYQNTFIEADRGNASSAARDDDGNFANTSATMTNGTLETYQGAWAVEDWVDDYEGVRAGQWTMITAENGSAMSRAEDTNGSYIKIGAEVENGSLETNQWVEAVNSARGYQNTSIVGDFALAFCEANNTDRSYFAYVANRIDGNASLEFEGNATVNASEAWANLSSHAEGDRIRGLATSTFGTISDEYWGSCNYDIVAYENGTSGFLAIAKGTTI